MRFFPKRTISKDSISFRLREDDTSRKCFKEYIEECTNKKGEKIKKVVFTPTDQTLEQITCCIDCCIERMKEKNTIKGFSTINIIRFISALSEYEPANQNEYTAYKICQALWASEEEARSKYSRSLNTKITERDWTKSRYELLQQTESNRRADIFYLK